MFKKIINLLRIQKRKIKSEKKSYSFGGVDLIINYFFKDVKRGFYLDVGAQHPISNNNTYLLNKKGWSGINIDLDKRNIDLFNLARPNDLNINSAISSKIEDRELYFYHEGSPINTINKKNSDLQKAKVKEIKKIRTNTLNEILKENEIKEINYLNIDVEGSEIDVLRGLDLQKYKPQIVSIEYLDFKIKSLEFKYNNIDNILESDIYKHMTSNGYNFVNWNHGDLIFVNKQNKE